jgi:AraC-like DNA-binding protein
VDFSGVSELVEGYRQGGTNPQRHMVIVTEAGEGYFLAPQVTWRLLPGTALIAPPVTPLAFGVKGASWTILWFYMTQVQQWAPLFREGVRLVTTDHVAAIRSAMEGYLSESALHQDASGNRPSDFRAARLYAELLAVLLEKVALPDSGLAIDPGLASLQRVWRLVREDAGRPWSMPDLAAEANVSAATLQRLTKKHFNTTPWQMVMGLRMERARTMLAHTAYPLKVIADTLGYASPFVFSTAFKHVCGQSPREYRRLARCS